MITLTRLAAAQYKGIQSIDLSFPERGSFLIEGRNEAGKSTLFDAVHFGLYGVPLVGDLADAIHYGGDEMAVHLGFHVGGTELKVRRNIRQTAKTLRAEAELEVVRGDDVEVVRGARAVSSRLQQELGGLTSEALLNSCLVAQKQLGRLETLSRSSREDALTVLLNLGKLSDVHSRLRVKPEDEARLRQAQARVELAHLSSRLAEVDGERGRLERTRRLIDLSDALDQLHLLQEQLGGVTAQAAAHEERLLAVREQLTELALLKDRRSHWQRLYDLTQRAESARQEVCLAEERVREAQEAAGRLPSKKEALQQIQEARDSAQALIDARTCLGNLRAEAARIAKRLEDRAQLTVRCGRLTAQLDELRRQRRGLQGQVMQLAPLTAELEASRARLEQFQQLAEQLRVLDVQRDALASLEEKLATRLEIDNEIEQAGTALLTAQRTLIALEEQREAEEQRRNLEERADCLARWIELARAREAAIQTRRLLDDLALAVAGVEHIGLTANDEPRGAEPEFAGLHLSLVADHPLTGALVLRLQLWAGGGRLVEVRPANKLEAAGLEVGALPSLSAAGAEAQQGDLAAVEESLVSLGEPVPATLRDAVRRLERLDVARRAPRPPFDPAAHQRALATAAADERTLLTVKAKGAKLAEAAILRRQAASAAKVVASLEQRCTELARQLKLSGRTADAVETELPAAINAEQERSNQLSVSAGQREGLMAQIAILDRNGRERAAELEECTTDLKADSDASLQDARTQVERERQETETESARLHETVAAFMRDHHLLVPEHERENPTAIRDLLQRQVEALSAEVAVLEGQVGQLEGATARVETARELTSALAQEIALALEALDEEERSEAGTPDDHAHLAARAAEQIQAITADVLARDEATLRAEEQDAQREAGSLERHLESLHEDRRLLAQRAQDLAAALGHMPSTQEIGAETALIACIHEAVPEVAGALPSREDVDARLRALDHERGGLERGAQDARTTLGDVALATLEEAAAELATVQQDLTARRRGQEIVGLTRQRMINKVLPDTIDNMCLLLPLLTAGRYRYAELTPDYRLQVWDERKKGFVEKNLFSGGTQDQFSLALRLGFALAALPRELGTSPGFLFLDEPLSSFDRDRTEALVNLLTHGQIATFFHQVFLISHSQAFDPGLFSHHIVMEEGKIVESTLAG